MKIIREIIGQNVEIELTKDELFTAYCEQQEIFDISSCANYLDSNYQDEAWYSTMTDEKRRELLKEAAAELRRNIDKYDMYFEYAMSAAFVEAIARCVN